MQLTNASRRAMRKQNCATAKSWSTFAGIEQSADVSAAYRSPFEGGLRQSVRGTEGRIPKRQREVRPGVERTVCRRPQWGFRRKMRGNMLGEGGAKARPSLKDVSPCGELAAPADCWPLIKTSGLSVGLVPTVCLLTALLFDAVCDRKAAVQPFEEGFYCTDAGACIGYGLTGCARLAVPLTAAET